MIAGACSCSRQPLAPSSENSFVCRLKIQFSTQTNNRYCLGLQHGMHQIHRQSNYKTTLAFSYGNKAKCIRKTNAKQNKAKIAYITWKSNWLSNMVWAVAPPICPLIDRIAFPFICWCWMTPRDWLSQEVDHLLTWDNKYLSVSRVEAHKYCNICTHIEVFVSDRQTDKRRQVLIRLHKLWIYVQAID